MADRANTQGQAKKGGKLFEIVGAGFIILLIVFGILYFDLGSLQSKYNSVAANYSSVSNNYSTALHDFNVTAKDLIQVESSLTLLQAKYNQTTYNLTNRYTQTLFSNYTTVVGKFNINYTYTYYAPGGFYNYTFNAPYSGYLVFNATGTPPNSRTWTNWAVYFSQQTPIWQKGQPGFNSTTAEVSTITPLRGTTYFIPISKGPNYMLIYNLNGSTPLRITALNMKYVGYYSN